MSERKIIGYSAGDDGWPPKDGRSSFAEEAYGEHPGNAVRDSFHSPREQLANALTRLEKNSQPLEARPIPPLFPKQPLSGTAKYFVVGARVFAGSLMLVLWVAVVGPIWFAILLRTISSYSIATVMALFTGASAPDVARLDAVAELWVNGFRRIITTIMQIEPSPLTYVPLRPMEALYETLFAILLYTGLFSTLWTIVHLSSFLWRWW